MAVYHVSWYLAVGGLKEYAKIQTRAKKSQNVKISQENVLQFLAAYFHVQ